MKQLSVDTEFCVGHGRCYRIAPSAFRPIDAAGHAEAIPAVEDAAGDDLIERAVQACPEMAIEWVDR